MPLYIFMKFGSVGRTDAPIALPLGVSHVFCSSVGGVVRARARHFGALRKPLERNQRKSLNSIALFQECEKRSLPAREVLKKQEIAFPCCMASTKNIASHAAWECDFLFFQHLSRENRFQKIPLLFLVGAKKCFLGLPVREVLKKRFCITLRVLNEIRNLIKTISESLIF